MRQCLKCNKDFKPHNWSHVYCSKECRTIKYFEVTGNSQGSLYNLSPSTSGALSELIACVDLIRQGYDVFRALSPSCSCDLIVVQSGKTLRVEVRTGQMYNDSLHWPKKPSDKGKSDVTAIVIKDQVFYDPPLKEVK